MLNLKLVKFPSLKTYILFIFQDLGLECLSVHPMSVQVSNLATQQNRLGNLTWTSTVPASILFPSFNTLPQSIQIIRQRKNIVRQQPSEARMMTKFSVWQLVRILHAINKRHYSHQETAGIRAWHPLSTSLELKSSFPLSLGMEEEGVSTLIIEQLTWRLGLQTFAVTHYKPEGASMAQLWLVPQGTETTWSNTPLVIQTSSQDEVNSTQQFSGSQHNSLHPGPYTPAHSPTLPSIAFTFHDAVNEVTSSSRHQPTGVNVQAMSDCSVWPVSYLLYFNS